MLRDRHIGKILDYRKAKDHIIFQFLEYYTASAALNRTIHRMQGGLWACYRVQEQKEHSRSTTLGNTTVSEESSPVKCASVS